MALINKLENLGDAIREKTGTTDLLTLDEMAEAVRTIPAGLTVADLTFSDKLSDYTLSGDFGTIIAQKYKDLFSFENISKGSFLFNENTEDLDGVTINIYCLDIHNFMKGYKGTQLPKLVGSITGNISNANIHAQYFLSSMLHVREIPKSFYEDIVWNTKDQIGWYYAFSNCTSLRTYPKEFIDLIPGFGSSNPYAGYQGAFSTCTTIDEITGYPVNNLYTFTSNMMTAFLSMCYRLANFTFATNEDGSPLEANWKNQTIGMNDYVGYGLSSGAVQNNKKYSSITIDKEVKDDATYQALKDDPDWFTSKFVYSRYNHDSAVRTINSLPDTSVYLATAGGTNTIKFKGEAGSKTDGGAINTLTEEEIAVATAKGWTVTLV